MQKTETQSNFFANKGNHKNPITLVAKDIYLHIYLKIMILQISQHTDNHTINLVLNTLSLNKQAIVFVNTKKSAEKTAEDIAKELKKRNEASTELDELSGKILNCLQKPTKQCERLAYCIKHGIAFHHSGLVAEQRRFIEENFRNHTIRIICATTTLAYGLDLPAYRTIIKDLRRYGYRGMAWIPVLEYLQMAGRSGRPKYDTEGQAICIAASERDEIEERYINGKPEVIDSKLAVEPVLRTYLLSLISANFISTRDEIIEFFGKTFWAFHFKDMERLIEIIDRMLNLLQEWGFIITGAKSNKNEKDDSIESEFVSASDVSVDRFRATLIGRRVAELYIDPYSAHFLIECINRDDRTRSLKPIALLQMIMRTNELRPLFSLRQKEYEIVEEILLKYDNHFLEPVPSMYEIDYEEYLDSVKTAIVFDEWINEEDENNILEKYNVRPGELRGKIELADWMLYATEEIARLSKQMEIISDIKKLRIRLRYGVKEELITLLRLDGIGRVRARKLYSNGIRNIADIKNTELVKLTQILGDSLAKNIKKQVDEEIKPISLGRRKGQINLADYD